MNDPNTYPPGWDREKVQEVIDYYERQSDDDAAAEIEATPKAGRFTMVAIPNELLPAVRALIATSR